MADFIFSVILIFFAIFGIFQTSGAIFRFFADRKTIEENTFIVTRVPNQNTEMYVRDFMNLFEDHQHLVMITDYEETRKMLQIFSKMHPNIEVTDHFNLGEKQDG